MQSATKISLITLVIAVAALVFALWPVVADAPWENALTEEQIEEQIYETISAEMDAKVNADADEKEAERLVKCEIVERLLTAMAKSGTRADPLMQAEIYSSILENHCL